MGPSCRRCHLGPVRGLRLIHGGEGEGWPLSAAIFIFAGASHSICGRGISIRTRTAASNRSRHAPEIYCRRSVLLSVTGRGGGGGSDAAGTVVRHWRETRAR